MRQSVACLLALLFASVSVRSADLSVSPCGAPADALNFVSVTATTESATESPGVCPEHPAMMGVLSESGEHITVGDMLFPLCTMTDSDSDGDGYGWESERSCVVYPRFPEGDVQPNLPPDDSTSTGVLSTDTTAAKPLADTASDHAFLDPVFRDKGNVCEVDSLETLQACAQNSSVYSGMDIVADLSCSGRECCPQNAALLSLSGNSNFTIHGNNHLMHRRSGHRQCSLIEAVNVSGVVIENWHLDDDGSVPGCRVADKCPRMVHIRNSVNVTLDGVHVSNGKGYNVYIDGVDGFTFHNSSIVNAGILGLYVGHGDNYSSRVAVTNSLFTDVQTNAVALLGVGGSVTNIVSNNTFIRNHRFGHWAVNPKFGIGMTGGGQVYIARAENVLIEGNRILDGYCENCFISNTNRTGIHGIELGEPHRVSLSSIRVTENLISNNDGSAIYLNEGNGIDSSVFIGGNTLINNTDSVPQSLHVNGAAVAINDARSTAVFESFEGNDLSVAGFTVSRHCSHDSTVSRVCDGRSLHGNCAVSLTVGSGSCESPSVSFESRWFATAERQSVSASGWVIRGAPDQPARVAEWCLEFADVNGQPTDSVCKTLSSVDDTVQGYTGLPFLDVKPPAGSARARWVLINRSEAVPLLVDDVKVSGVK